MPSEHWTALAGTHAASTQALIEKAIDPICNDGKANNLVQVLDTMKTLEAVLNRIIDPTQPGTYMGGILEKDSQTSKLKATKIFDVENFVVELEAKVKASKITVTDPKGSTRLEAQRQMQDARANHQVVIGHKEGIIEATKTIYGKDIVNAFILDPITRQPKSLDDYQIADLIEHIKKAALQPTDKSRRAAKCEFLSNYHVSFQRPVEQEISLLNTTARHLDSRGAAITAHDKALVLRDEVAWAAKQPWAPFNLSNLPNKIKALVPYDKIVDDALYKKICELIIKEDKGRDYSLAPAPPHIGGPPHRRNV